MKRASALSENPNCERTKAIFRITAELLDPDWISRQLRLTPSHAHAKGDSFSIGKQEYSRYPRGVWYLCSEDQIDSTNLEKHLHWLLEQLEPRAPFIRSLIDDPKILVDFVFTWVSRTGHGGPVIQAATLKRLSDLSDDVSFDFYGPYEDDAII